MAQDPLLASLADSLRQRLSLIADRAFYERDPAAHLEELKTISERIVQLQGQLPRSIDPQFRHYLERCSYDKALAFLEAA